MHGSWRLGPKPQGPRIDADHILGAAIGAKSDWQTVTTAVDEADHNHHSANGNILKTTTRLQRWARQLLVGDPRRKRVGAIIPQPDGCPCPRQLDEAAPNGGPVTRRHESFHPAGISAAAAHEHRAAPNAVGPNTGLHGYH